MFDSIFDNRRNKKWALEILEEEKKVVDAACDEFFKAADALYKIHKEYDRIVEFIKVIKTKYPDPADQAEISLLLEKTIKAKNSLEERAMQCETDGDVYVNNRAIRNKVAGVSDALSTLMSGPKEPKGQN